MKTRIMLILAVLGYISYAIADTPGTLEGPMIETSEDSGAYLNLNTGIATLQYLPTGAWAANANIGYNFTPGFAVEGGYTLLLSSQYQAHQSNNIYDIALKGTIPLSDSFGLYGRLGGGLNYMSWGNVATGAPSWYVDQRSSVNFVGLASAGASFKVSEHFDLNLEDTMFIPMGGGNATSGNTNMVLGGVQYNF